MNNRINLKSMPRRPVKAGSSTPSDDFVVHVIGGIHSIQSVSMEPETSIRQWQMFVVRDTKGKRTRHLVGRADREGRVSSPIQALDFKARTAQSLSGRVYRLEGRSGCSRDGTYVFNRWLRGGARTIIREVTAVLERLLNRSCSDRAGSEESGKQQGAPS